MSSWTGSATQVLLDVMGSLDIELSVVGYSFGAATGMLFGRDDSRVHRMIALAPPLGKVSFEFLAGCPKPSLHLIGTKDLLYSQDKVEAFRTMLSPAGRVMVLEEADHFFRGDEDMLAREVEDFLRGICQARERRKAV